MQRLTRFCAGCRNVSASSWTSLCLLLSIVGLLVLAVLQPFVVAKIRAGILQYAVLNSSSAGSWPGFLDSNDPTGPEVLSVFYVFNVRFAAPRPPPTLSTAPQYSHAPPHTTA
jgi:hypothetical protein